jgi:UDP-N-acetylmuramoyl-L-alanyl-D-glutamate--2,6-diaminopimelate ligase
MRPLRLIDLIDGTSAEMTGPIVDGEALIHGVTEDSRAVTPGALFAALPGTRQHGRAFIGDALARGATAVLAKDGTALPAHTESAVLVTSPKPRQAFSQIAARFHPGQPRFIAGITGTNGKTSVASFCRQIWAATTGGHAASLGTLGLQPELVTSPGSLTTPDPVALHRCLADLTDAGVERLAMEISSHGLDQERVDGLALSAAAFTNLSQDHLDYHGDMEHYFRAKARLFADVLPADGTAVINADAPQAGALIEICRRRGQTVWTYGRAEDATLRLDGRSSDPHGQDLRLTLFGREVQVRLPLVGRFQVLNALAALGLTMADGLDLDTAVPAIEGLEGAPGRMQRVADTNRGATVFVDYAHTPGALETVLDALRPHANNRLIVVFGAGGERDTTKRPKMGEVAAARADRVIVTDDNPRGEDPVGIREAIMKGAPAAENIGDRADAIRAAITGLNAGDVVLIAGKGHETGQIVGETILPFDDTRTARAAVAEQEADG